MAILLSNTKNKSTSIKTLEPELPLQLKKKRSISPKGGDIMDKRMIARMTKVINDISKLNKTAQSLKSVVAYQKNPFTLILLFHVIDMLMLLLALIIVIKYL